MTAKEFLKQVFNAYQEAESKLEQMARLQSLATRTTTVIHSAPVGNALGLNSRIEQAVMEVEGQSENLAAEIKKLLEIRNVVAEEIVKVENSLERRVLEYRYLCFFSWKEISHVMKIGLRTLFRLHDRALKNFEAVSKCH